MPRGRAVDRAALLAALALGCIVGASTASCALDVQGQDGTADVDEAGSGDATIEASGDAIAGDDATADASADGAPSDGGLNDAASDVVNDTAGDAESDAATDAADGATDAGTDATTDAGSDAGTDASQGGFTCDGGTVASCSMCSGATQDCVYCASDGGMATSSSCIAAGIHCNTAVPSGFKMCGCDAPDASLCPLGTQVCHDGIDGKTCRTCGEPNTNGDGCKQGGTCGGGSCN